MTDAAARPVRNRSGPPPHVLAPGELPTGDLLKQRCRRAERNLKAERALRQHASVRLRALGLLSADLGLREVLLELSESLALISES